MTQNCCLLRMKNYSLLHAAKRHQGIKVANKSDSPSQRADPWRDHFDIHKKATRNRMQDPAFHLQALFLCESIQDSGIQGFKRSEGRAKRDPELLVYI